MFKCMNSLALEKKKAAENIKILPRLAKFKTFPYRLSDRIFSQ